ncbi:predicted protein [Arabidopsis lyrata subsp. lyrata]|uniref:Predicted protein n=1 Tax=Arabidopsis lyrata subsp. lyrata TaxID=81972 RepID=D7LPL9_ARALL|nr:predicted protein [Arabidopsis lyrata subsp. lyrata]
MAISHVHLVVLLILSLLLLPTLRAIDYSDCGKNITGGVFYVDVIIDMTHLSNYKYDLCTYMACPIAPGAFVLPLDNIIPFYPLLNTVFKSEFLDRGGAVGKHVTRLGFEFHLGANNPFELHNFVV